MGGLLNIQLARATLNSQRAAISVIPQSSCLLFNLPRELRDEIYSFLVPSYTTLDLAAPTWWENAAGRFYDIRYDMSPYSLTVLALCQQIRAEASALLYGTNHFELSIGRGNGPSPFNTVRSLPQSGIRQIKACTVRVFIPVWTKKREIIPIRGWMDELCELFKQGGNLQEIEIELNDHTTPFDERFQTLLEPLEGLSGLKSAIVKGQVAEAYGAELKKIMEGNGTKKGRKRNSAAMDNEEALSVPPKKKRQTKNRN
jgi:hypothetical protein